MNMRMSEPDAWKMADEAAGKKVHMMEEVGLLSVVGRISPMRWRAFVTEYQEEAIVKAHQNDVDSFRVGPFSASFGNWKKGKLDGKDGNYVDVVFRLVGDEQK